MSKFYKSAMSSLQQFDRERKDTAISDAKRSKILASAVGLGMEVSANKKTFDETSEFMKQKGFQFDKDSSSYFKTFSNDDGMQIGRVSLIDATTYNKNSALIDMDDFIYNRQGEEITGFSEKNKWQLDPEEYKRLRNIDITKGQNLSKKEKFDAYDKFWDQGGYNPDKMRKDGLEADWNQVIMDESGEAFLKGWGEGGSNLNLENFKGYIPARPAGGGPRIPIPIDSEDEYFDEDINIEESELSHLASYEQYAPKNVFTDKRLKGAGSTLATEPPDRPIVPIESEDEYFDEEIDVDPSDLEDSMEDKRSREYQESQIKSRKWYDDFGAKNIFSDSPLRGATSKYDKELYKSKVNKGSMTDDEFDRFIEGLSPNQVRNMEDNRSNTYIDRLKGFKDPLFKTSKEAMFQGKKYVNASDSDEWVEMVGGKKSLVNSVEKHLLNAPYMDRGKVEEWMIQNSKYNLRKQGKSYPEYESRTGMPKYSSAAADITGTLYSAGKMAKAGTALSNMAIPGLGWASAALAAVDWIAGSFSAAKQYKKEARMLKTQMGGHRGEMAEKAGEEAQRDLKMLQKDYDLKMKNMTSEYGKTTQDLQQQIGKAWSATKGLYTGNVGNIKEDSLKRLNEGFEQSRESANFNMENAYDKYVSGLDDQMGEMQVQLEDMYQKWRHARKHSKWYKNL